MAFWKHTKTHLANYDESIEILTLISRNRLRSVNKRLGVQHLESALYQEIVLGTDSSYFCSVVLKYVFLEIVKTVPKYEISKAENLYLTSLILNNLRPKLLAGYSCEGG